MWCDWKRFSKQQVRYGSSVSPTRVVKLADVELSDSRFLLHVGINSEYFVAAAQLLIITKLLKSK